MGEKEGFFLAIPQLARKYHSLYDKVYAMGNLREAWTRVKENKGAGGVDGESIQQFGKDWERNLAELQRLLKEKRYVPPPVRRHYIRMRLRAFKEKKKAVRHQNRRIPNRWLAKQGLISLTSLLPEAH